MTLILKLYVKKLLVLSWVLFTIIDIVNMLSLTITEKYWRRFQL